MRREIEKRLTALEKRTKPDVWPILVVYADGSSNAGDRETTERIRRTRPDGIVMTIGGIDLQHDI